MASSIIPDDWKSKILPPSTPSSFSAKLKKGMAEDKINDRTEV